MRCHLQDIQSKTTKTEIKTRTKTLPIIHIDLTIEVKFPNLLSCNEYKDVNTSTGDENYLRFG